MCVRVIGEQRMSEQGEGCWRELEQRQGEERKSKLIRPA